MEKTEFVSLEGFVDDKYLSKKATSLTKDEDHQQFMDDLGI